MTARALFGTLGCSSLTDRLRPNPVTKHTRAEQGKLARNQGPNECRYLKPSERWQPSFTERRGKEFSLRQYGRIALSRQEACTIRESEPV